MKYNLTSLKHPTQRVQSIKALRNVTGLPLTNCRNIVEGLADRNFSRSNVQPKNVGTQHVTKKEIRVELLDDVTKHPLTLSEFHTYFESKQINTEVSLELYEVTAERRTKSGLGSLVTSINRHFLVLANTLGEAEGHVRDIKSVFDQDSVEVKKVNGPFTSGILMETGGKIS